MKAGLIPSADSPALLLTSEPEAAALTAKHHRDLLALQTGGGRHLMCSAAASSVGCSHTAFCQCIESNPAILWQGQNQSRIGAGTSGCSELLVCRQACPTS